MVEGVIQKSKKILKISKKLKLDSWGWLSEYSKPKSDDKKSDDDSTDLVTEPKYIQDNRIPWKR